MADVSLEVAAPAGVADVERAVERFGLDVASVVEESDVYAGYPTTVMLFGQQATLDEMLPRLQAALRDALGVDVATGDELEDALSAARR